MFVEFKAVDEAETFVKNGCKYNDTPLKVLKKCVWAPRSRLASAL